MVNRENYLLVTIWLFLILAVGFGAFAGSGLTGPDNNVPPAGTAYAETTEALASVMWQKLLRLRNAAVSAPQWAHQGITSRIAAFPEISMPYQAWGVNLKALPDATLSFLRFGLPDAILSFFRFAGHLMWTVIVWSVVLVVVGMPIILVIGLLTTPRSTQPNYATRRQRAYVGNVIEIR